MLQLWCKQENDPFKGDFESCVKIDFWIEVNWTNSATSETFKRLIFAGPFRVISSQWRTFAHISTRRWPTKLATSMVQIRFWGCSCSTARFSSMGEPKIDFDRSFITPRFPHLSSFFVISGFLAASNLLSDDKRTREIKSNNLPQNARLYAQLLLHRYIRLTPLLILSMLISLIGSSLLDDVSIFWQFCRDDLKCSQWVVFASLECFRWWMKMRL